MVAASGSGSFTAGANCNKTSNSVVCAATKEGAGGFVTVLPANVTATICPADASFGATASATVKAPFQPITPFIAALLGGSDPMLSATATARCAVFPAATLPITNSGNCTIPDLIGQSESTAASVWAAASFTGSVTRVGTGSGWSIVAQAPASGGSAACTSGVTIHQTASTCTVPAIGKNWYFADYKPAWIAAGFTGALTDSTGVHKVGSVIPAVGTSASCTSSGTANWP